MFDWFAARPPRSEVPTCDRPSIPLTAEERLVFDSLSRQVEPRYDLTGRLLAGFRSVREAGSLPAGVVLVVLGGLWCIAWLAASVPVSFLGVLAQALGLRLVIDAELVRRRRDGSAARPAASREQTHAHRRRDR